MADRRGVENFKDGWRLGYFHGAAGVSLSTHREPPAGWPEWREGYRKGWEAGQRGKSDAIVLDARHWEASNPRKRRRGKNNS